MQNTDKKPKLLNAYQIQATPNTSKGWIKKIGEVYPIVNIPIVNTSPFSDYKDIYINAYLYVLSEQDILNCGLNLPMVKFVLTKNKKNIANIWYHFNTTEKLTVTTNNFKDFIEKKMNGYFSIDCYQNTDKGQIHYTLETNKIFIGPDKIIQHMLNHTHDHLSTILANENGFVHSNKTSSHYY